MVCREAAGERVIQVAMHHWVTQKTAELMDLKVTQHDGIWMTIDRAEAKKTHQGIMKLPPELRLRIYDEMIESTRMSVFFRGGYSPRVGMILHPIVYSTKPLRAEYLTRKLELTTFSVENGPGNQKFQDWLGQLDLRSSLSKTYKNGFDAVRSLAFPFFSRYPHSILPPGTPNNDIVLMQKCNMLKHVIMCWAADELNAGYGRTKTLEQLSAEYRLDGLLGLKKLEKITMTGFRLSTAASPLLQELADWLKSNHAGEKAEQLQVELV